MIPDNSWFLPFPVPGWILALELDLCVWEAAREAEKVAHLGLCPQEPVSLSEGAGGLPMNVFDLACTVSQ